MTNVEVTCVSCGIRHIVTVPTEGYKDWLEGRKKIQHALPSVSEDDRELLMSGICPACWNQMFG